MTPTPGEKWWTWWLAELEHHYGAVVRDTVDNHEYHDLFLDAIEFATKEALSEKTPINKFGAPITVTSTEPQSDPTLLGGLFPKTELSDEFATIYVTFREIKDGDVAKTVQRTVSACCDYDAAGKLIGVEIFDVLPEPA